MDRQFVCSYIHDRWPELQREAIVRATAALAELTSDDVCNRFLAAGEKYGDFDIDSIDAESELHAEFLDIVSYLAIGTLQE